MANGFSVTERNALINASRGRATHVTLFNGDPGGAGTEVAGITRAAVSWGTASNGSVALDSAVELTVPANRTFDHIVMMTASTGGNIVAYGGVPQKTYPVQDTYQVSSFSMAI